MPACKLPIDRRRSPAPLVPSSSKGLHEHFTSWKRVRQAKASKLRFITPDKESSMNMLWQEEEFEQICSREALTEKAAEIEKTIFVKEHERACYDFEPAIFTKIVFGIGGQMA